jgi:hypothetical protein
MESKVCTICGVEKPLDEFYNKEKGKKRSECKICTYNQHKKFTELNRDRVKEQRKKSYDENRASLLKNKKETYEKNRGKFIKRQGEYSKNKKLVDPIFKFKHDIRNMINKSLKIRNYTKKSRSFVVLGCSFEEFVSYIESKFEPWMNWSNHGNPKDGIYELNKTWDIDHIEPLAKAKTEEDIIRLNHYTNLQPLCSYVNRFIKKDK